MHFIFSGSVAQERTIVSTKQIGNWGEGTLEIRGFGEDAACFGEEIDSCQDKESGPSSAEIGYRVKKGKVCSSNDWIGYLRIECRGTDEHHSTMSITFVEESYLMKLVDTWAMITSIK